MKNVLYIGNNLAGKAHNVSYIKILGGLLEQEGYTLYYASSQTHKLLRLLDMLFHVIRLRCKVDVVLIDTYSTQNFYYAYAVSQLCRWLQLDYIPILHGGNLPARLESHPKLSSALFNHAKHIVSPSLYLKEAFETNGYKPIVHIPNTVQLHNYTFQSRTYETLRLLWVRSFSKIYNPQLAIHVFQAIKKRYPDATLCMVGPDSDGSLVEVQELAKELDVDVEFTGKLSKSEWISRSQDFNIFINTTNFDNTPVSVIEAMALGLPVVSTNVGGMPYLISNNVDGLLVAPNQINEMVDAIVRLKQDESLRQQIVKNARSKVEKFDWKVVKPKWDALLS
ncbi:glycosyltransferase involved in cell wall biosynthesis [Winogradskyella epiphytica]|uniref:Glycosyltransferase involved in cell wall biosynthesis n=1 Tax=Winogradskyella epiphytica TaxID=262005 RepID=A0A2V4WXZ3_9FLAO|nr:glycosyltransferase family 4 protein [Winogradskyella epiphytica]PYE82120.1 glycosyltransferase involved in cell wall biosynthesis [Winogradskyella epiphytica]GGW60396.1 hypothetical protein GCM10008085_09760 [Winogradskyella epiphytica]